MHRSMVVYSQNNISRQECHDGIRFFESKARPDAPSRHGTSFACLISGIKKSCKFCPHNKVTNRRMTMEIMQNVKFDDIFVPFEDNARVTYEEDSLQQLANSIKKDGLSHPLTVRRRGPEDNTECPLVLVAGFRRYLAMTKILKLEMTPSVHVTDMGGVEAAIFGLNENLAREDITTYEKARGLVLIRDRYNIGPKEISKRLSGSDAETGKPGFKHQTIGNLMRIMDKLCDDVKEEWKNNHPRATTLTLLAIIRKETPEEQVALWQEYVKGNDGETLDDDDTDPDDETNPDETDPDPNPAPSAAARPSKHKIIEAIAAIRESKHSKEWKDAAIVALEWAAGSRKRLPGISHAKKPAKKEK